MEKKYKKILYWTPRILCILFILFISMFALDIFWEDYSILETFVGLFMHLIPSFILIGLTILAWKREKLGGIAFIVLGIVFTIFFHTYEDIINFLLISLPVFIVGALFLIHNHIEDKPRSRR